MIKRVVKDLPGYLGQQPHQEHPLRSPVRDSGSLQQPFLVDVDVEGE